MAVLTGIIHTSTVPVLVVAEVRPNLVLVAVVLATAVFGLGAGVVWAFAAGTTVTLLGSEPLGSAPLALLAVAALVAGADLLLGRLIWVFPVLAAFAGSVIYDTGLLALFDLLGERLAIPDPASIIVPAAVLNAALTALVLLPVRLLAGKLAADERPAW